MPESILQRPSTRTMLEPLQSANVYRARGVRRFPDVYGGAGRLSGVSRTSSAIAR